MRLEGTSSDHLVYPPSSKQRQLQQVAHGCVQTDFAYIRRWRIHNLSVQLVSVFDDLHSKKNNFLVFKCNFLYYDLCPLPLDLSLGTKKKKLPLSFTPSTSAFLFASTRYTGVSPLAISSVTVWLRKAVRKLSLMHSRNLLGFYCPSLLSLQQILWWLKFPCEHQGLWTWGYFLLSEEGIIYFLAGNL